MAEKCDFPPFLTFARSTTACLKNELFRDMQWSRKLLYHFLRRCININNLTLFLKIAIIIPVRNLKEGLYYDRKIKVKGTYY